MSKKVKNINLVSDEEMKKKLSDENLRKELRRASKNYANYDRFKETALIAIEFRQTINLKTIKVVIKQLFFIYQEGEEDSIVRFLKEVFEEQNYTRDNSNYWLSERGLLLLELKNKNNYPIFGHIV